MLHFVIFSFNRGDFLAHCLESIRHCAPGFPVMIIDDNSTDPATISVLDQARADCRVIQPRNTDPSLTSKHGGLYANLQLALDTLDSDALMCTLQDDMQLARVITQADAQALENWFMQDEQRGFVHQALLKGSERGRNQIEYSATDDVYYNMRPNSSAGTWYSDIFVASVGRLKSNKWQFGGREAINEQRAQQLFARMAYWRHPFVAWLPAAPTWRGKRRTLALRLGEKKHHCGFYPLTWLEGSSAHTFLTRAPATLPYAEDFLKIRDNVPGQAQVQTPWVYHPLQGSRWLKWLNSLELKLR